MMRLLENLNSLPFASRCVLLVTLCWMKHLLFGDRHGFWLDRRHCATLCVNDLVEAGGLFGGFRWQCCRRRGIIILPTDTQENNSLH